MVTYFIRSKNKQCNRNHKHNKILILLREIIRYETLSLRTKVHYNIDMKSYKALQFSTTREALIVSTGISRYA